MCYFIYLKAKNEEKLPTIFFTIFRSKPAFLKKKKKILKNYNLNFNFETCSLLYKEGFCLQKSYFKGLCDFLKMKTLPHVRRAHTQRNSLNFWNWTHKNIANRWQCGYFRKSQTNENHSTLLYSVHMSSYCHTTVSYCSRVFVVQVIVNLFNVVPVNVIHVSVGPSVYQKQTYYI